MKSECEIQYRDLTECEYTDAIEIMNTCWNIDYSSFIPAQTFRPETRLAEITEWMTLQDDSDWRMLYGAFRDHELLGFLGASYAEIEDSANGIEINYLFVKPRERGQGIAQTLVVDAMKRYMTKKAWKDIIIYVWRDAQSHVFYKKHGAILQRSVIQEIHGRKLVVDIYRMDVQQIIGMMNEP